MTAIRPTATALRTIPVRQIIRAIADAAARWADADFPPRVRILDPIAERTGYSIPVIEYALDRLFESITESALSATISHELPLDALDAFVERKGRPKAQALSLGRVAVISSRTTIGVGIVPAIFALCAKNEVVVKDREDRLTAAFFTTLIEEHNAFTYAAKAETWNSDTPSPTGSFDRFDCVVAFGHDKTLQVIRNACPPQARFIGFGSKASVGYIPREILQDDRQARIVADEIARDIVLYESEGCLSLHALFIEINGGVLPKRFLEHLAAAIDRAHVEFPIGKRDPATAANLLGLRDTIDFRNATGANPYMTSTDVQLSRLLVLDPPKSEPPYFLPCALPLYSVTAPEEALAYLRSHHIAIEAIATGKDARKDVVAMGIEAGAARIARFGELQSPLLEAHHGGHPRIAEFVRWVTDET